MGSLPSKHSNSSLANSTDDRNENDPKNTRRRGRPFAKAKELPFEMQSGSDDDGMFQISALTKIFAG